MTRWKARLLTGGIAAGLIVAPVLALAGVYLVAIRVFRMGDVPLPTFAPTRWVGAEAGEGDKEHVQGWTRGEAARFHHTGQGTIVLPSSWFRALEQPLLSPLEVAPFADRSYMERFGFNYDQVADDRAVEGSVERLYPIGFAVEDFEPNQADDPWQFETKTQVVGLTCAACHTGRIDLRWEGTVRSTLIEGGAAMIDLKRFQDALGKALFLTKFFPERFRRFARAVLKDETNPDRTEKQLHDRLEAVLAVGLDQLAIVQERKLIPVEAGFGRTDALGLIGNRVFGVADERNLTVINAPVNFPHLWDTAWFDWVQYNASIRTPMARNIGEALGVMALLKVSPPTAKEPFGSVWTSVNVPNLAWMEDLLGGNHPFANPGRRARTADGPPHPHEATRYGLQPPRWRETMGNLIGQPLRPNQPLPEALAIDPATAIRGKQLYVQHCQGCHLHPRDELQDWLHTPDADSEVAADFTQPDRASGKRFLKLRVADLDVIGTDPNQALNFYRRIVYDSKYPGDQPASGDRHRITTQTIPAETGLYQMTSLLRANEYRKMGLFAGADSALRIEDRDRLIRLDRYRSVPEVLHPFEKGEELGRKLAQGDPKTIEDGTAMGDVIAANLGYKARPLDGIWATPPFLHNGSVPTLDDLLKPADQRPKVFYTGTTLYDPARLGYETTEFENATKFDTSYPGNSNEGHEFRNPTLRELEEAYNFKAPEGMSVDERMAYLLGVSPNKYATLSASELRDLMARVLRDARNPISIRGRIGPALDDDERASLLAYLKSI